MHRYAEGDPRERFYQGLKIYDEAELVAIDMAKRLFGAEFADLRPISGCNAVLCVLSAFAKPGDKIMALSVPAGAHISQAKFGAAGIRGLETVPFVFDEKEFNIDIDATAKVIRETEPKLVTFGGSLFPFPHPVKELAPIAKEVGATVAYDAAHVLGLIAGKQFQDPLREGAEVMCASTHKTFFGPQGGIIFTNTEEKYKKVKWKIFPALVSNHHLHRIPSLAVAIGEMLEFGEEYASQVVKNAQTLAKTMHDFGFNVICPEKGFTKSHQAIVDVSKIGGGAWAADACEDANIILNKNLLPWDDVNQPDKPSGLRIGAQEMTRYGMKEDDIKQVAELLKRVIIDKEDTAKVKKDVTEFRNKFQEVQYTFK